MTAALDAYLVETINAATRALPSATLQKMYRQAHEEGDRMRATTLWEAWVAAKCREGDRPDALRRDAGTPTERFWACVIDGLDGHLVWTGQHDERGRPVTPSAGSHKILAQRFAYVLKHGPMDNVYLVYSTCGEPNCLNVEHLERMHRASAVRYTQEAMIGALQAYVMQTGKVPTIMEFDEWRPRTGRGRRGLPTGHVIAARFGSWPKAIRAAGYEPRRTTTTFALLYTNDDALTALRAFHAETGRWPAYKEWMDGGYKPSYTSIRRRFGTWAAAIEKAAEG